MAARPGRARLRPRRRVRIPRAAAGPRFRRRRLPGAVVRGGGAGPGPREPRGRGQRPPRSSRRRRCGRCRGLGATAPPQPPRGVPLKRLRPCVSTAWRSSLLPASSSLVNRPRSYCPPQAASGAPGQRSQTHGLTRGGPGRPGAGLKDPRGSPPSGTP